jgi:glutamate racemase
VPVIGAVGPGAARAVAATRNHHIGVIGTLATVRSGAYVKAIAASAPRATVTGVACPLFVPLAEEGWTDDEVARLVARRYLATLFADDPQIDTLVLGCTHYPVLRAVLTRAANDIAGRPVAVVDSATAMAEAAAAALSAANPGATSAVNRRGQPGQLDCFATDTSRLDELAARFLGEPPSGFELVDL